MTPDAYHCDPFDVRELQLRQRIRQLEYQIDKQWRIIERICHKLNIKIKK